MHKFLKIDPHFQWLKIQKFIAMCKVSVLCVLCWSAFVLYPSHYGVSGFRFQTTELIGVVALHHI